MIWTDFIVLKVLLWVHMYIRLAQGLTDEKMVDFCVPAFHVVVGSTKGHRMVI